MRRQQVSEAMLQDETPRAERRAQPSLSPTVVAAEERGPVGQRPLSAMRWVLRTILPALFGALVVLLAYQVPAYHEVNIGRYDAAYVQGFYDAEPASATSLAGSDGSARWTRAESYLLFPQIGLPAKLHLRLRGWDAPAGAEPVVLVQSGRAELARLRVGSEWQEVAVALNADLFKSSDVLIVIRSDITRLPDGREVGILLDSASLATSSWPLLPYPSQLVYGAAILVLVTLLVAQMGSTVPAPLVGWALPLSTVILGLAFVLLYRLQPPLYPYPLRGLLPWTCGLLASACALRCADLPVVRQRATAVFADGVAGVGIAVWAGALLLVARAHVTLSVPGVEKDFRVFATRSGSLAEVFQADGFYNLGYPFLLWLTQPLVGGSAFLAARLLGVFSGALLLGALYLLARNLLGAAWALVALLVLALSPLVVQYGLYIGSDMPFAALVTLSLTLLVWALGLGTKEPEHIARWCYSGAGAAAGTAFLVRHPGLLLLPFGLVAIWLLVGRLRWPAILLFVLGFAIAAAPQIAVNTLQTGSPLYSQQAKNIWLAVYGNTDWQRWEEVPNTISLAQVVLPDPARFIANWWGNLRAFTGTGAEDTSEFGRALQLRLLGWPANWLALAGLVGLAWRGSWRERLLPAWVVLYATTLSIGFLLPRFLLPLAPLYALAAAWLLQRLASGRSHRGRAFVAVCLLGLLLLWPGWRIGTQYVLDNQPPTEVAAVALVESSHAPNERLLARLPAESPLAKYSSIAHYVTTDPSAAALLLTTEPAPTLAGRSLSLVGQAGVYQLYRIAP